MTTTTNQFQFKSREISLDFAGKVFTLDLAKSGNAEMLTQIGYDSVKRSEELRAVPITRSPTEKAEKTLEVMRKGQEFILEAIDRILGEGAHLKIFEGRKVDYFDALDVLAYIIGEVKQFEAKRISERTAGYTNRAQKRAATKAKKA